MEHFKEMIALEEGRLGRVAEEMRTALAGDQEDREKKNREISELKRQKLDAVGWREKREIDEAIDRCRQRNSMRRYQDPCALRQPYFGILELDDDDFGVISTCLGRQSFFDRSGRALVIDWREAPVSRLYYEYDAGELYEEEIRGRERSGAIRSKRQVDTAGAELRKIVDGSVLLSRSGDGSWHHLAEDGNIVIRGKEDSADHRLPEITALISREQFGAITRPDSSTVLLQGGAGSGKTTVGLHRIAYLAYHDPDRFQPRRMLVVMFNRSLQQYMSRVLPELGIGAGVNVETYHSWAGKVFRAAGVQVGYGSTSPPSDVVALKKHSGMLDLADRYLDSLLSKSRKWLLDQLAQKNDPDAGAIADLLHVSAHLSNFLTTLSTHRLFVDPDQPAARNQSRSRLLKRLNDHVLDLHTLLTDRELLTSAFCADSFTPSAAVNSLALWQMKLRNRKIVDFADTAILLWLMQRKGIAAARPGYAHIMVDEAQDLSEVELATLLYAADSHQSITICGDMAQKIKDDVSFAGPEGFAGFIRSQQERTGAGKLCSDTLEVGYRATRPIMELAWHVLGERPAMAVPRRGKPVEIWRTADHRETVTRAGAILEAYLREHPQAIIAVICRYKADADRVYGDLKALGLPSLRRHERDDFSFQPGIIVTNAHQVKGLEFSAVLAVNPSAEQFRDDSQDRMLLHVVFTRAADRLWIVGHQPVAYGIDPALLALLQTAD